MEEQNFFPPELCGDEMGVGPPETGNDENPQLVYAELRPAVANPYATCPPAPVACPPATVDGPPAPVDGPPAPVDGPPAPVDLTTDGNDDDPDVASSKAILSSPESSPKDDADLGDSGEYYVEAVLNKRFVGNAVELLVKWKNYPVRESTWEPIEFIFADIHLDPYIKKANDENEPARFVVLDENEVAAVSGILRSKGHMEFLIRYKDDTAVIVPAQFAFQKFPNKVAEYLDKIIKKGTPEEVVGDNYDEEEELSDSEQESRKLI